MGRAVRLLSPHFQPNSRLRRRSIRGRLSGLRLLRSSGRRARIAFARTLCATGACPLWRHDCCLDCVDCHFPREPFSTRYAGLRQFADRSLVRTRTIPFQKHKHPCGMCVRPAQPENIPGSDGTTGLMVRDSLLPAPPMGRCPDAFKRCSPTPPLWCHTTAARPAAVRKVRHLDECWAGPSPIGCTCFRRAGLVAYID